jgi:hypothetical protein
MFVGFTGLGEPGLSLTLSGPADNREGAVMATTDKGFDPGVFVPDHARDNYFEMARAAATQIGGSATDALHKMAEQWWRNHESEPMFGWEHLAGWAENATVPEDEDTNMAVARAYESVKRAGSAALLDDDVKEELLEARKKAAGQGPVAPRESANAGPLGRPAKTPGSAKPSPKS